MPPLNVSVTQEDYAAFVKSRVKWFPEDRLNILHACVGLVGEVIEYIESTDWKNELEELGDIEFYMEHLSQSMKGNLAGGGVFPTTVRGLRPESMLLSGAGQLLDYAKKVWVYGKDPATLNWLQGFIQVGAGLELLYHAKGITQAEVRRANMEKLLKRYPEGYTDAAAQARADKQGEQA